MLEAELEGGLVEALVVLLAFLQGVVFLVIVLFVVVVSLGGRLGCGRGLEVIHVGEEVVEQVLSLVCFRHLNLELGEFKLDLGVGELLVDLGLGFVDLGERAEVLSPDVVHDLTEVLLQLSELPIDELLELLCINLWVIDVVQVFAELLQPEAEVALEVVDSLVLLRRLLVYLGEDLIQFPRSVGLVFPINVVAILFIIFQV